MRRRRGTVRSPGWWSLAGLLLLAAAGCTTTQPPVRMAFPNDRIDTPVVFVPGTTGTTLRDRETGKDVWGRGRNLIGPLDRGYAMAVPIGQGRDTQPPRLEPGEVIEEIRLPGGVARREIYGPLIRLLVDHGYRRGDLRAPGVGETFFPFAYDWRQDTARSAQQLLDGLERLRRVRGDERLPVVLICQSTAVNLCRYLVKYGACSVEEAAAGKPCSPGSIVVSDLILIAPSTGGSLRTFHMLHAGRRYLRPFFRKWQPETLFSLVGLYQDLPAYRRDLLVDGAGEPLDIDLSEAGSWQRYGWSVFGRRARSRLAGDRARAFFGTEEERIAFLEQALANARRFHELLHRDVADLGDIRYHLILNHDQETAERAVVVRKGDRWRTLFPEDRGFPPALRAQTTAAGDGHATSRSQLWLSPQELAAMAGEPLVVAGEHFDIIVNPTTHRQVLTILRDQLLRGPLPDGRTTRESTR